MTHPLNKLKNEDLVTRADLEAVLERLERVEAVLEATGEDWPPADTTGDPDLAETVQTPSPASPPVVQSDSDEDDVDAGQTLDILSGPAQPKGKAK